ncbi:hypothetical protein SCP_1300260 [Sparassis crispa]|uniref:HAMP domain-containing protein n=1 Tax=Sparassis crispa TaxID=139825 RepID=A0A401H1E2_9APHY|nr:hypothetical protein SCP_1300260 [Sparassis crispa]GBE88212.1 hypothetical protein SCP_1300260 [Sparassis crispa]
MGIVNKLAANLTNQVRSIAKVTKAVTLGDLSKQINVDAHSSTQGMLGVQARVEGVQGSLAYWSPPPPPKMATNLTDQVRSISEVTKAVANGDLSRSVNVDVQGEMLDLKMTVNQMVARLLTLASEVTRVSLEVGTEGIMGVRHGWPGIRAGRTGHVEGVGGQRQLDGDELDEPVDVRGEMLDLKVTVNGMTESLSVFADKVTRVAKEVGTEGKLGGQAQVMNVGSTWRDFRAQGKEEGRHARGDYVRTRKDVPPHIMAILENVDKASLPPDGVYPTPSSSHIQSPFPMHARPLNSLPLPVPAGSSALPSITEESNEGEVVLGLITIRGAPSPGRDSPPVQPGPRLSPPPQADGPPDVENVAQQDQVDQSERSDNSDGSDDSIEEPLAQAVRRLAGALPLPRDNCPHGGVHPRKPSQRRNHRQGQHGEQDMFEDHDLFAGEGAEENKNDDDEEPGDPAGHDNLPKGSPAKWGISDLPAALNGWPGKTATKFLCDLISGAHGNFQAPSVSIWVESMKDLVEGRSWDAHDGAFRTNALWALVSRVSRAEKVLSGAEFVSMMTKIQLAAKVDSIQKTRNTQVAKGGKMTMAQVYSLISEEPDAPKEKTFSEWVAFGHRFAALAGAGSVYLLMIIAAHGMYSQIGRTKQATIWTMCNCLRWPNPDTLIGQHILGRLIPLASGLSSNIDCRDFVSSDKFFSMFITNTFRSVDRHSESWAPCMTPLTSPLTELEQGITGVDLMVQNILTTASSTCSTRPPSTRAPSPMDDSDDEHHATTMGVCENSDNNDDLFMVDAQSKKFYTPDSSSPNYLVFDTDFRPQAKKNRKAPYPKTDPKERLVWTDEQRHYAGDAWVAKTLENFEEGIQEHYNKDGVKFANSYIYLSRSAFEGKEIRLNSKEGELLAFIASDMSQDMKDTLERGLRSVIFSDGSPEYELQSMDSSASTGQHQFPCIHFSRVPFRPSS